jgi:cell division protein FtsZ
VMSGAGSALMGIGSARGDNRAISAAELAIASPLLEASMEGAHGVLLSISGGSDLGIFEINEAASMVADSAHPEANIIFGAIIDDALGDEVRVTVIAAGFDGGSPKHKPIDAPRRETPAAPAVPPPSASTTPTVTSRYGPPATSGARGGSAGAGIAAGGHVRRTVEIDEELDVPDFLKG